VAENYVIPFVAHCIQIGGKSILILTNFLYNDHVISTVYTWTKY